MTTFSRKILNALVGTQWGTTVPLRVDAIPPPMVDGRTVALSLLRRYISDLTFRRPGDLDILSGKRGEPISFAIPRERIHVEWPDDEVLMQPPSIVFLQGSEATYEAIGMTPYVEERTLNVYGPGTVVQWQSEYTETVIIQLNATTRAERRSIVVGLENAMVPVEEYLGLRFIMRDYYGQPVVFTLDSRRLGDDPSAALNRRQASLSVGMRFNIVQLVSTKTMTPMGAICVDGDEA